VYNLFFFFAKGLVKDRFSMNITTEYNVLSGSFYFVHSFNIKKASKQTLTDSEKEK
jgi:imidazoleglycerol phosphate synthase glutamine amidotransferase subunit HisH